MSMKKTTTITISQTPKAKVHPHRCQCMIMKMTTARSSRLLRAGFKLGSAESLPGRRCESSIVRLQRCRQYIGVGRHLEVRRQQRGRTQHLDGGTEAVYHSTCPQTSPAPPGGTEQRLQRAPCLAATRPSTPSCPVRVQCTARARAGCVCTASATQRHAVAPLPHAPESGVTFFQLSQKKRARRLSSTAATLSPPANPWKSRPTSGCTPGICPEQKEMLRILEAPHRQSLPWGALGRPKCFGTSQVQSADAEKSSPDHPVDPR